MLIPKDKDKKDRQYQATKQQEQAQTLALECFSFIFADDEKQSNFLRLTGANIDDLKNLLSENHFLISVLSFIMEHESWLLEFAQNNNISPQDIPNALHTLSH